MIFFFGFGTQIDGEKSMVSTPVFEKVWILKIQQLDQKLWLSKVNGVSIDVLSQFS